MFSLVRVLRAVVALPVVTANLATTVTTTTTTTSTATTTPTSRFITGRIAFVCPPSRRVHRHGIPEGLGVKDPSFRLPLAVRGILGRRRPESRRHGRKVSCEHVGLVVPAPRGREEGGPEFFVPRLPLLTRPGQTESSYEGWGGGGGVFVHGRAPPTRGRKTEPTAVLACLFRSDYFRHILS